MKNATIFLLLLSIITLSSCLKEKNTFVDPNIAINKQFTKDSLLMAQFIIDEEIDTTGVSYGVLYEVTEPGSGNHNYSASSKVTVKYKGRLLNGTVFDETTGDTERTFSLGQVISGWQIGIQKIQAGGKIRLIIPSYYGYGTNSIGVIPANSVLDFDIELIKVE